ncbi:MAG TPA: ABC transporter permease [Vicinamibacterales bacterium]|nr:ABC transporter permease [Vicinamibacterales bacterium]
MFAWFRRLRARIRYRSFDADLRQEIDAHRAMAEAELRSRGVAPGEARAAASRAMGNVTLAREDARGVWLAPWLESVWQDVKYGVRSLRRSPAFTITALLTMTIGIGISTAMFTTINAVILRPWPIERPEQVVLIKPEGGAPRERWQFGLGDRDDFASRSTTLSHVAATHFAFFTPAADPEARTVIAYGQFVTPGFFETVGVPIALGRNFRPDDDREGAAERVAIISHAFWHRMFGGARDAIGRALYFQKQAYTVIGVAREGWRGEQPYRDDIWLPLQAMRNFKPEDALFSDSAGRCCVALIGRLAAGATAIRAAQELTAFARQRSSQPDAAARRVEVTGTSMYARFPAPLRAMIIASTVIATAIVLLLTGANIAHLQLARALARAREVRTRLALGAGRSRIARQLITEAVLLSTVAGVLGLALVYAVLDPLMRISEMPTRDVWAPDAAVFTYCVGTSLLMSFAFSLLPALRSTRIGLATGDGRTATPAGRLRFNLALLTAQIALSTSLLSCASLLTRAVTHAISGDIGYSIDGVTTATYRPGGASTQTGPGAAAARQTIERALTAAFPRIAFTDVAPFTHAETVDVRRPAGSVREARSADIAPVSANAFEVLGIPLVTGRPFSGHPGSGEAVVNETFARLLWPQDGAVGQRFVAGTQSYTVVGVTRDVYFTARDSIRPTFHVLAGRTRTYPAVLVRTNEPGVTDRIAAIITDVDANATVTVRSLADTIAEGLGDSAAGATAAWAGGLLALALATFGVFGVFAYVVEARRREIGIRIALGAQKGQVLSALFRPARVATVAGLVLGLLLSLSLGSVLQSLLFGLSPFDPTAFGVVAAILTAAGVLATYVPVRRALRVDPAVILKQDA